MPAERRREKIENLLREELGKILDRNFDFPAGTMVTVTHITTSSDGHYGNVYISILGQDPKGALAILKKNIYHIQKAVNRRLRIRPVPKLVFKLDREELNREKVERSIAGLKKKGEL
jgi:ribosome-binding factor A